MMLRSPKVSAVRDARPTNVGNWRTHWGLAAGHERFVPQWRISDEDDSPGSPDCGAWPWPAEFSARSAEPRTCRADPAPGVQPARWRGERPPPRSRPPWRFSRASTRRPGRGIICPSSTPRSARAGRTFPPAPSPVPGYPWASSRTTSESSSSNFSPPRSVRTGIRRSRKSWPPRPTSTRPGRRPPGV